ncbi:dihydrolipoamide acetyltransferase family protein [Actinomadura scrupuli]|uniref:dihydrolipoamide acetyltransferase family protein n=1 Tax=Actinomadura scrupuli TaxID=559629 RepID=UPI003D95CAD2
MAELKQFKLPDVGEGLTEAEIVKWHVQPGDAVEVNQTIVEIETAKAIVELPCPFEGVVAELHATEGETIDVGVPIISVDVSPGGPGAAMTPEEELGLKEDLVPTITEELPPSPAADPGTLIGPTVGPDEPKRQPVLVGYGVKPGATKRRPRKQSRAAPAGPATGPDAGPGRAAALAKPPVRKLAKDLGVDLSAISGSGPQGSITRDDVQAAVRAVPAPAQAGGGQVLRSAPEQAAREERIPIRGVRKHTAAAMTRSAFTAPHVTEFLQVDVTETMAAVRRLRALPDFADVKVSPLLLVAKALLVAAARHPAINSSWDEDAQEIVVKRYVNLGIAAATERGLIVPNIKEAQDLSLPGLARALTALGETARAGKTSLEAMSNGTITISNVGIFGVDAGTPILSPGEAAILAFGQIRELPWVHEGQLAVRQVTTLSLSFDHRIVDGELGSAVLRDVGAALEDPLRLLAWS